MINDIVANDQIETTVIEREPLGRISLKELGPPLDIDDESVNTVITRSNREPWQRVNAYGPRS